ncbi:MAG: DUF3857 domain-containing protein [Tsuneonella sp.]
MPADASGLAFVRSQDTHVHLDATGQQTFISQRVKLLHAQALQIGNIAVAWNPAAGSPTFHTLNIIRGDETIDVMKNAKFEVIRREDQLEQATLSGILTAVLKVPDLRVGDELEWAYTLPSSDPTLKEANAGILALSGSTLPGRYRLGLSWDEGQGPKSKFTEDFGAPLSRDASAISVLVDNPSTLAPPKDAPPRYQWQRAIEYSDFPSWSAVSSRFATLFQQARKIEADSPIKIEATRIAAQNATPLKRAQAALALVQAQVRYVYVGLDGGNYRPSSAEETWHRRYGDCKGKTALLLALLDELGIDAQPVLVNNSGFDDGYDQRLPNPGLFDHVLVRVTFGKDVYWMDGTMPDVVEMSTEPVVPYRWVLPLSAAGIALESVRETVRRLPDDMGLVEIDARAGFDKPARKSHTIVQRGIEGVAQYLQLSALTGDQLTEGFQNSAAGGTDWDLIEKVSYRYDRATQASILTIVGTGSVDWDKSGDGFDLVLPGGGFSPPARRQRASQQDQNAPYYSAPSYSCHATTVRLPDSTSLDNWGFNSTFDTMIFGNVYYRMMELRKDRTIRMVRGSRVERPEITAEEARRDNQRLERFDNSKAMITYDPAKKTEEWGNLKPVPATYEIDWAGPDAPCLPADVLSQR